MKSFGKHVVKTSASRNWYYPLAIPYYFMVPFSIKMVYMVYNFLIDFLIRFPKYSSGPAPSTLFIYCWFRLLKYILQFNLFIH
jgi:hypothetical protein